MLLYNYRKFFMTFSASRVKKELKKYANPKKAKIPSRFFKTGQGEYGYGDVFLGISVPDQRKVAGKFKVLSLSQTAKLLKSRVHEHRLTALLILVGQFQKAEGKKKKQIFDLYLKNYKYINNWDLVDLSAPKIVGAYLLEKPEKRKILYRLARSKNLWKKRIAMLSTYTFIKNSQFKDTLKIAEILLNDKHNLIHKAVGWMLREIGKIDQNIEELFLKKHYKTMPRTMLRYAIERFNEKKRKFYLGKK